MAVDWTFCNCTNLLLYSEDLAKINQDLNLTSNTKTVQTGEHETRTQEVPSSILIFEASPTEWFSNKWMLGTLLPIVNMPKSYGIWHPNQIFPRYSQNTCPRQTKLERQKPSFLHWENFDFLRGPFFWKVPKWPWSCHKTTYFKSDQNGY